MGSFERLTQKMRLASSFERISVLARMRARKDKDPDKFIDPAGCLGSYATMVSIECPLCHSPSSSCPGVMPARDREKANYNL